MALHHIYEEFITDETYRRRWRKLKKIGLEAFLFHTNKIQTLLFYTKERNKLLIQYILDEKNVYFKL